MAMKQKMGRPPLEEASRKSKTFRIRFTDADRKLIEDAAGANGAAASEWAREVLLKAAVRVKK